MAKVSRESVSHVEQAEGFEGRYEDVAEFTIGFEHFTADFDGAPLFVGLPDDACQSPHWGYVLSGQLTFSYTDGTRDVIKAGEAYYAHPGHTPAMVAGTQVVEFSDAAKLAQTMQVVMGNIAAATA